MIQSPALQGRGPKRLEPGPFFAGLIFSTAFREAPDPSALFGANLIGATLGGLCEYLGMWVGSTFLSYLVIVAYVASLLSMVAQARGVIRR